MLLLYRIEHAIANSSESRRFSQTREWTAEGWALQMPSTAPRRRLQREPGGPIQVQHFAFGS
jgi:hypothetical protein